MIDTHCHLNFPALAGDLEGVLERAEKAGVSKMIVPGVDAETSASAVELAARFPGRVFAAVGIHPSEATADLSGLSGMVAIGEVGLDYFHADNPPKDVQEKTFREMIALARYNNLPLIIHTRDAFADTYAILRESPHPAVIHCFSGTPQEARAYLDLGCLLSFTGMITYKKNAALREMVAGLPLDRIMTETDAPLLAPEGYRGQTCEPWHVSKVVECLAEIYGKPAAYIDQVTQETAEAFFSI